MRLFVSLAGSSVNELRFDRGPIYIGRQKGTQVFIPDPSVSRQHAVIYTTKDGTWILEDLGSANKTYLNTVAIHKAELKSGDVIQISDFQIRVSLEDTEDNNHRLEIEKDETLIGAGLRKELHTVERNLEAGDAPPIRFPAKRSAGYARIMERLYGEKSVEGLFKTLEEVLLRQFNGLHVWVSVRREASGPMDVEGGRKVTTETIKRPELAVPSSLDEALEKHKYMLIHQLPRQILNRGIRSVLIAPIMFQKNCHGVLYLENSTEHSHYSLADLDYLILIALYAGIVIQHIKQS